MCVGGYPGYCVYTLLCICTFVALPHPVLCTSHSVCCVFIVKCVGVYVCVYVCVYIMCVCVCVLVHGSCNNIAGV